jgi:hypothetical protein
MVPKIVLHKRNGHRRPPAGGVPSARDLVRLVHSAPASAADVDLLKLAAMLRSEGGAAADAPPAGDGRALPPALAQALEQSREAFARGELADVQAMLAALGAPADLAASLADGLAGTVEAGEPADPPARRALVSINDLLLQTLGLFCAGAPGMVEVSSRLDPRLPYVAGDHQQLGEALLVLLLALPRAGEGSDRPGVVTLGTSHREGVLRGEPIVRVVVTDARELEDAGDASAPVSTAAGDLGRAARIVKEHGGILSAASARSGHLHFTVELPAV